MLVLEALRAKYGDSLLLHFGTKEQPRLAVIDGGPPGVYNDALKPRLDEIRKERKLPDAKPLDLDLMMVSHIDEDHIAGILQLVRKIKDLKDSHQPVPWRIRRFWHNSFDDILGNEDAAVGSSGSAMSPASIGDMIAPHSSLILASVGQGRDLRKLLAALSLDKNPPFNGLVQAGKPPVVLDNLKLTVVAPLEQNLIDLQTDWDKKLKPILKKEKDNESAAQIAAYVDGSVYNLSSIVVLAEADGKRILLTGDGRGDHTLVGLEKAGLLQDGKIEVDVLKLPHHGSIRNLDKDYFETIRTPRFLISADGKFDNPDLATLELISKARPDDDFTIHLTYPTDQFNVPEIGAEVAKFFEAEKAAGRKYKVETRAADALSFQFRLA